ncbi:uncharacterized protein LOC126901562 isoform X3 [Daktulosphaira vitifoliae]|uniref:uncharacterized protein LOC126901562 isoform X3 n=1 Tax=Daktulosphaira vitifoliae TaxID=58002 RepID=UPI0021AA0F4E|nr:uncharacterized protein LOC126901562 isoform X3 [Daktulosphaira vitifoliae]
MFKNKIVLLLFVIYITIAFAVPSNIVEYNNSEVSPNDAYNDIAQSKMNFPDGFMSAEKLHEYMKNHLPNITKGITLEKCHLLVQEFAKVDQYKGLTLDEYYRVHEGILLRRYDTEEKLTEK